MGVWFGLGVRLGLPLGLALGWGVPGGVAEFEGELFPVVGGGGDGLDGMGLDGMGLDGIGVDGLCGLVVCASHGGSVPRLVGRLNGNVGEGREFAHRGVRSRRNRVAISSRHLGVRGVKWGVSPLREQGDGGGGRGGLERGEIPSLARGALC